MVWTFQDFGFVSFTADLSSKRKIVAQPEKNQHKQTKNKLNLEVDKMSKRFIYGMWQKEIPTNNTKLNLHLPLWRINLKCIKVLD